MMGWLWFFDDFEIYMRILRIFLNVFVDSLMIFMMTADGIKIKNDDN
jgi:hypothetical protein